MPNKSPDTYKDKWGGEKILVKGWDNLILKVREVYPNVHMEGSTGYQRSYWLPDIHDEPVAHSWLNSWKNQKFWLRIKPKNG